MTGEEASSGDKLAESRGTMTSVQIKTNADIASPHAIIRGRLSGALYLANIFTFPLVGLYCGKN